MHSAMRNTALRVALGLALLAPAAAVPAEGQAQVPDAALTLLDGPPPPELPKLVARDAEGRTTVRAVRLDRPLVVDGRLDDEIYGQVEAIGDFIQQEPHEGQPATEKTEAWVFFDAKAVYVAARCWDSEPERRVANEMRRDHFNLFQNDHFGVIFDTFRDRRNGFLFYVNPLGGLFDGQTTDERETNRDWNTVWDAKVGTFSGGWTVEIAIPFRSLRYRPGAHVWGINFRRAVRWKNELSYLTRIPAAYGRNGLLRLSRAAALVGIEPPPVALSLEVKPYATGGIRTDVEEGLRNDPTRNAGFDLKYGVTRGLTADFTVNTDFAQVEDDEQRVNLTRFSLFFPEKRDFFLEGQGIFQFGGVGGRGGGPGGGFEGQSNTPFLFFSRRIGLVTDQAGTTRSVPIVAGGRLTGKSGPFSLGLLHIRTGDAPAFGAVTTDFSVLRVKRDILRRSTVGFIATRRAPAVDGGGDNYAFGVDAGFSFFQNLNLNAYYARTRTPGAAGDEASYRAQVEYAGDRYGLELERLSVGSAFRPEVGFVRRRDMIRNYLQARFSPRPARIRAVRKFGWEGSLDYITDRTGRLETREVQGQFRIEFENGDEWNLEGTETFERLDDPFEIADGVTIPAGDYRNRELQSNYRLGPQRRVSGFVNASWGRFYDGERTQAGYRGRIEVTPSFSVEPGLSRNWVDLPYGRFTTTLASVRTTLTLSPRMFAGALVQFNSAGDLVATNVRFRWEYVPGSDFYIVYSEGRDTAVRGFPALEQRALVVKLAHLLRF
jgi:hypothetical protein